MNKSRIAARAALNDSIQARNPGTVGTDLSQRTVKTQGAQPPARNRRATRMTSTQRDSTGRMSAWNRSPYTPKGGWR